MSDLSGNPISPTPRCVALVGPQGGGKTSLLESILYITGTTNRKGSIKDGNTVGDSSDEAKSRLMSTDVSVAQTTYLGDTFTFLDCPGSVELSQDTINALMAVDAAVVVCEPDLERSVALTPLLRFLDDHAIPHVMFINKMDTGSVRMHDVMEAMQASSTRPLVLRQVPTRDGDTVTGYVDLVSERAYEYRDGEPSALVKMPESVLEREQSARQEMLEHLADFDDALLEQLLEDVVPAKEEIYQQLTRDLAGDLIVPVLMGGAEADHGIRRLLKLLRHEVPQVDRTVERLAAGDGDPAAIVFKTVHAQHSGKLSFVRVLRGTVNDGMNFGDNRVSGVFRLFGTNVTKQANASVGDIVALGRMDDVGTGDLLVPSGVSRAEGWPQPLTQVYALAVRAENRNDEVKLTGALQKLTEEDPSLAFLHDSDVGGLVLSGQGDVHLQLSIDRLARRYNVSVTPRKPDVPYRETIRKGTHQHARFKRQTGGHGQFGDVHIDIRPLPRGTGFQFEEKIVGGAIPRQYIPGVEAGVQDYLKSGPLGFPVVDVAVKLTDGQFHTVDSSDQAFRTAARMAMTEGMPKCDPVLLEPIYEVTISVPNEYTPRAQRLLSSRRGQILGFDGREGWPGWDEVKANLPQSELHDLIIELRSLTLGVGNYTAEFSHLQELTGREADRVVEIRASANAA